MGMSHARKDTLVAAKTPHRGPHLTKEAKRRTAKAERQAAKALVNKVEEQKPEGLGLHNDPERMRWMRESQGSSVIPTGIYCYDKMPCPYWDMAENEEKQCNGFCWFLMKGDWHPDIGELWDQCKCCGMREEVVPEGTILVVDERAET
jgi:hypothetical protein